MCYWCGKTATSTEHVPPRNLYGKGKGELRITVPSCKRHNEDFYHLDELFRVYFKAISKSPGAMADFHEKTAKSITRPGGLLRELVGKTIAFPDQKRGFQISVQEMNGYCGKVARGLYFFHYRDIFRGDVHSFFMSNKEPRPKDPELHATYEKLRPKLMRGVETDDSVFWYEYDRDPTGFFMHLRFYGDITVYCMGGRTEGDRFESSAYQM